MYGAVADGRSRSPFKDALPGGAFSSTQTSLLYVLPCLTSAVIFILFLNVYHRAPHVVIELTIALFVTFAASAALTRDIPFRFYVSLFCLIALFSSFAIGLLADAVAITEYWFLRDSNAYANVLPSELAAAYADAGKIVFADGSRIDVNRALGYRDTATFCVAPVVDDLVEPAAIQYWAVGKDCCSARGSFDCDDAWNAKAHSGIKVDDEVAAGFAEALRMAEVAYSITSAEKPLLVRWVADPETIELNYWRFGTAVILGGLLVQQLALALGVLGLKMAMGNRGNVFR